MGILKNLYYTALGPALMIAGAGCTAYGIYKQDLKDCMYGCFVTFMGLQTHQSGKACKKLSELEEKLVENKKGE